MKASTHSISRHVPFSLWLRWKFHRFADERLSGCTAYVHKLSCVGRHAESLGFSSTCVVIDLIVRSRCISYRWFLELFDTWIMNLMLSLFNRKLTRFCPFMSLLFNSFRFMKFLLHRVCKKLSLALKINVKSLCDFFRLSQNIGAERKHLFLRFRLLSMSFREGSGLVHGKLARVVCLGIVCVVVMKRLVEL